MCASSKMPQVEAGVLVYHNVRWRNTVSKAKVDRQRARGVGRLFTSIYLPSPVSSTVRTRELIWEHWSGMPYKICIIPLRSSPRSQWNMLLSTKVCVYSLSLPTRQPSQNTTNSGQWSTMANGQLTSLSLSDNEEGCQPMQSQVLTTNVSLWISILSLWNHEATLVSA